MNLHLVLLIVYSCAIVAFGIWTARLVRTSGAFFVAGRSLGPGLLLSSMLAANIGAGATIGATGLAYRDGLSAWWWVGSAGLGSLVFAFLVAPRLWTLARAHGFFTTGDYLEFRYSAGVRAAAAVPLALGSLALLAGQLIAGAAILNAIIGIPRWAGALAGGAIATVYFTAGGLLGTARVNMVQLAVTLASFAAALPVALGAVEGPGLFATTELPERFGDFWYSSGPGSGWTLLALTGPAFIVSPGLIQKAYGAASARVVRLGIAANAAVLLLFAFVPVTLGTVARTALPGIADPNLVLPALMTEVMPAWLGAMTLAAVFTTEVNTCDAILFMLSTAASQDFYRRFVNPGASDPQLLRVGRVTAVMGGAAGVVLAIALDTVIGAVTVFYSLLVVTFLVPVLGGLFTRRAGSREALAAMSAGVAALLVARVLVMPVAPWVDPTLAGIVAAAAAYFLGLALPKTR